MKRRVLLSLLLCLPAVMAWAGPPGKTAFRIGVAPHSSARVILQMYQPLRSYLEDVLQQPVQVVTASDFTEFARRGLKGEYDLAITTGHQARLFESDAAYLPMLTYRADFKAVLVVAQGSVYRVPADLAGSTVMGLSPSSLVTIWGSHWLHRNNVPNVDLRYVSASDSAVHLVTNGEASAAMVSLANYQNLKPEIRERLRVLDESLPLAGRVYMLAPRHKALRDRLLKALWAFAETPEAKAYFAQYKLQGYRPLGASELLEMAPYANEVRMALKRGDN
ncbi:MAG: phosphate/phosphite/phosphonate ABC transporter substrate-binding protein [Dechloromonas sp.]|nr:phosphate/phosphite/phosphonate ABC transporter substrate-binding protein [Dechloromonas sp.]